MNLTEHNPQARYKNVKAAPAMFLKSGPALTVYKPMTWLDWLLMGFIALAVGFIVFLLIQPGDMTFTQADGSTVTVSSEQMDAAVRFCEGLEYTPDSPCAALVAVARQ